jgi:hypothetical protein
MEERQSSCFSGPGGARGLAGTQPARDPGPAVHRLGVN